MAAADDGLRGRLEKLRDDLEIRLDGASDRDFAALAARYHVVLTDLAALPDPNAAADGVEAAQAETDAILRLVQ